MSNLVKLMLFALLVSASARSQSSPSATNASPDNQTSDPRPTPDSGVSTQAQSNTLPDSTKLEPIKTVKATYPEAAREKQLQGQVWVKVWVNETGDVGNVEVISGDPVFAMSTVDAVKKWKFKPFIKNGKPTAVSTKLDFNFAFTENVHTEKVPLDHLSGVTGKEDTPKRVRVSQGVVKGLITYKVQPVYPPEARRERISGTVVLHAVISKEGRITDLQLVSGPKELAPAAIGAVQQWRYQPYLLMGNPVEVDTEVQVNFQLQ
jgi:TonB family protein